MVLEHVIFNEITSKISNSKPGQKLFFTLLIFSTGSTQAHLDYAIRTYSKSKSDLVFLPAYIANISNKSGWGDNPSFSRVWDRPTALGTWIAACWVACIWWEGRKCDRERVVPGVHTHTHTQTNMHVRCVNSYWRFISQPLHSGTPHWISLQFKAHPIPLEIINLNLQFHFLHIFVFCSVFPYASHSFCPASNPISLLKVQAVNADKCY